jgi:uncharacterized protein YodC (DUF2158 family)
MEKTKFKAGDVVFLKSDLNQKMTVKQFVEGELICVFFDRNGQLNTNYFNPETLMLNTKTNKCRVSFPCNAGHFEKCLFGEMKYKYYYSVISPNCKHFDEGRCTNRKAILDCLDKEGLSENN